MNKEELRKVIEDHIEYFNTHFTDNPHVQARAAEMETLLKAELSRLTEQEEKNPLILNDKYAVTDWHESPAQDAEKLNDFSKYGNLIHLLGGNELSAYQRALARQEVEAYAAQKVREQKEVEEYAYNLIAENEQLKKYRQEEIEELRACLKELTERVDIGTAYVSRARNKAEQLLKEHEQPR